MSPLLTGCYSLNVWPLQRRNLNVILMKSMDVTVYEKGTKIIMGMSQCPAYGTKL